MSSGFRQEAFHDKDRTSKGRSLSFSRPREMKKLLLFAVVVLLCLNSCASLLDGKFITKEGKKSPFTPQRDPYQPFTDPTMRP